MKVRLLAVFVTVLTAVVVGAFVFTGRSVVAQRKAQAIERTPISAAVLHAPSYTVGLVSHDVPAFVNSCGCRPNVAVEYINFGNPVTATLPHQILLNGGTPLLELLPYKAPLSEIIAGKWDTWLRGYALMVKAQRAEFLMSFAPEANGNWYKWGYPLVKPAVEVAAWRHVVALFRAVGATNTSWAWIVNKMYNGSGPLNQLWPGPAYVNEVGIDGYFRTPTDTFTSLFLPTMQRIRRVTNEPMFISETGANDVAGKVKALDSLGSGMAHYHMAGYIWFDIDQPGLRLHEPQNFAISNNQAALDVYKASLLPYERPASTRTS